MELIINFDFRDLFSGICINNMCVFLVLSPGENNVFYETALLNASHTNSNTLTTPTFLGLPPLSYAILNMIWTWNHRTNPGFIRERKRGNRRR